MPQLDRDDAIHRIAVILDKPSVYMGGPSQRSRRRAEEIVDFLAQYTLRRGQMTMYKVLQILGELDIEEEAADLDDYPLDSILIRSDVFDDMLGSK